MKDIRQLDNTEIRYICSQIPPDAVRMYFKNHPKQFNVIKPGFRADKLSNDGVITVLCNNTSNPFVSSFISEGVERWIKEIEDYIDQLVNEGKTRNEAILLALSKSYLSGNVGIYFKLTDKEFGEEYVCLVIDAIAMLTSGQVDAVSDIEGKGNVKKIEDSKDGIIQSEEHEIQALMMEKQANEQEITKLQSEIKLSQEKLIETSEKLTSAIEEMEEMKQELDHYKYLERYSDSIPEESEESKFQYTSMGSIYHNTKGERKLVRLADIEDGEIKVFECNFNAPRKFANRNKLFVSDGPDQDGFVGVWKWSAEQNQREPENDYITSKHVARYIPTLIIELEDCHSLRDLVLRLKEGIGSIGKTGKILYVYSLPDGEKEGVLCYSNQMKQAGAVYQLSKTVFILPNYKINEENMVNIESERYYRYMSLGTPQGVTRVRMPYEAVKDMVITRATNAVLRSTGLTNREAQHCQQFIKDLPIETLQQELIDAYGCSQEEADGFIQGFIEHAASYLGKTDIDTNVLGSAISRVPEFVEICKDAIKAEWEEEHKEKLQEAEHVLNDKNDELKEKEKEVADLELLLIETKQQKDQLEKEIKDKELLAQEVEIKVAKRIEEAKNNAAEFISQMAFIPTNNRSIAGLDSISKSGFVINQIGEEYEKGRRITDLASFEEELADNFVIGGFDSQVAVSMANTVSYSVCKKLPIIVGLNSVLIATCVSAMFDQKVVEISVPLREFDYNELKQYIIGQNNIGQKVFLIKGLFDGYNTNLFTALISGLHQLNDNTVILISLEGNSVDMLPGFVWNESLYIDGDLGLKNIKIGKLKAFSVDVLFSREFDVDEIKRKRKQLKDFKEFLSNSSVCLYSDYLSIYTEDCLNSITVLLLLIVNAKSKGLLGELLSTLQNYEISSVLKGVLDHFV